MSLVLLAGCGGGGGGGSSGGGGTTKYTGYQVSVVYSGNPTQMVDPGTLIAGDQLQMTITARDSTGSLVTLTSSGWKTNAPAGVASLTSDGLLIAVGSSNGTTYTVRGVSGGKTYEASIAVVAKQAIVTGLVRNTSNTAIEYATVQFYNASKVLVGETTTTRMGTFRASVPATTTRFTIDMSQADPTSAYYYLTFGYGTEEYIDGTTCLAPLPSPLSLTTANPLPSDIVPDLKTLGPPPPPTGCIG